MTKTKLGQFYITILWIILENNPDARNTFREATTSNTNNLIVNNLLEDVDAFEAAISAEIGGKSLRTNSPFYKVKIIKHICSHI